MGRVFECSCCLTRPLPSGPRTCLGHASVTEPALLKQLTRCFLQKVSIHESCCFSVLESIPAPLYSHLVVPSQHSGSEQVFQQNSHVHVFRTRSCRMLSFVVIFCCITVSELPAHDPCCTPHLHREGSSLLFQCSDISCCLFLSSYER